MSERLRLRDVAEHGETQEERLAAKMVLAEAARAQRRRWTVAIVVFVLGAMILTMSILAVIDERKRLGRAGTADPPLCFDVLTF